MPNLPEGYSHHDLDAGWAVLRDDLADALLAAGVGQPEELPVERVALGRVPHPIVDLGERLGHVVVRKCQHGGAAGRLMGRAFKSAGRAMKELEVTLAARERGAPVSDVVGVVVTPCKWGFKRIFVLSQLLPNTIDLRSWLESGAPLTPAQRQAVSRAVAKAVGLCHQAGLYHADLHVKNILLESPAGPEPKAYLIDLDKATLGKRVPPQRRLMNLARLNRSIQKWDSTRRLVTPRDKLRFFRAYQRDCGGLGHGAQQTCGRVPLKHRIAWLGVRLVDGLARLWPTRK